jgi:hypothetical protein
MRQKSVHPESPSERIVKNVRRATRKRHSSEEKIRIVLDGLRGAPALRSCVRREGIGGSITLGPRSSWRPASAAGRVTLRGRRTGATFFTMSGTELIILCLVPRAFLKEPRIRHGAVICPPRFAPKNNEKNGRQSC